MCWIPGSGARSSDNLPPPRRRSIAQIVRLCGRARERPTHAWARLFVANSHSARPPRARGSRGVGCHLQKREERRRAPHAPDGQPESRPHVTWPPPAPFRRAGGGGWRAIALRFVRAAVASGLLATPSVLTTPDAFGNAHRHSGIRAIPRGSGVVASRRRPGRRVVVEFDTDLFGEPSEHLIHGEPRALL